MNFDRFGFKAICKSTETWAFARMAASGFGCFGIRWSDSRAEDYDGCHIYPETLCQCTGLKDSDGRLIYENDIVQVADRKYTVVYHEPSNTREIQGETEDRSFTALQDWIQQGVKCIVIGNKWDKEEPNGEREVFADKVGKNNIGFEGEPETIQIPYWLAWSVRSIQGEKSFEEYVLDAIEDKVKNDNLMRMTDARLLENYLQIYRRNRDEQKADSGNAGFDSKNQNHEDNGNRGADK